MATLLTSQRATLQPGGWGGRGDRGQPGPPVSGMATGRPAGSPGRLLTRSCGRPEASQPGHPASSWSPTRLLHGEENSWAGGGAQGGAEGALGASDRATLGVTSPHAAMRTGGTWRWPRSGRPPGPGSRKRGCALRAWLCLTGVAVTYGHSEPASDGGQVPAGHRSLLRTGPQLVAVVSVL